MIATSSKLNLTLLADGLQVPLPENYSHIYIAHQFNAVVLSFRNSDLYDFYYIFFKLNAYF